MLFADVVRSMAIASLLDMERLREVMTELVERLAAVLRRYGGTVEYNGDGVMAIFGAPIALEDHAFRACVAALAIQEETDRLAAEVQRRDGVDLRVRVGLNSIIVPPSMSWRADGHRVGCRGPPRAASIPCVATRAVARYRNSAWFRRGTT